VALTYVIVTDMVTLRERGKWFSVISLQWAIGGAFAQKTTWRWIFWLNIPFCVISAMGIPVCLRLSDKEESVWTRLNSFDWFGSFLFVAATTSFLIPLTWVYTPHFTREDANAIIGWCHVLSVAPANIGPLSSRFWWSRGLCGPYHLPLFNASHPPHSIFQLNRNHGVFWHSNPRHYCMESTILLATLLRGGQELFSHHIRRRSLFPLTFTTAPAAIVIRITMSQTGRYRPSIVTHSVLYFWLIL
jgi:hypothetical protein